MYTNFYIQLGIFLHLLALTVDAEPTEGCSSLKCSNAVVIVSGSDENNIPFVTFLDNGLGCMHNNEVRITVVGKSINSSDRVNNQFCTATHWASGPDLT